MNLDEKRKYPRVMEAVSCQVRLDQKPLVTLTRNISCGGALCELSQKVAPMTKLDIAFELPGVSIGSADRLIRCTGVVVRQEPADSPRHYLTAIFFQSIRTQDRRRLAEFVVETMLVHARRNSS